MSEPMPTGSPYRERLGSAPGEAATEPIRFTIAGSVLAFLALLLLPPSLYCLWSSVKCALEGAYFDASAIGALGVICGGVLWGATRVRVELQGDTFRASRWGWSVHSGHADEFVGFESDHVSQTWELVRSRDLAVLKIPSFDAAPEANKTIERWLSEHFTGAHSYRARKIERGSHLAEQRTLSLLAQPFDRHAEFLEFDVDLQLSCAARAAGRFRYHSALPALHRLLLELPHPCMARQHVIEALRSLGSADSCNVLVRALDHPRCPREQVARALSELATKKQRAVLESLIAGDDGPFVKCHAKRALRRVGGGPPQLRSECQTPDL